VTVARFLAVFYCQFKLRLSTFSCQIFYHQEKFALVSDRSTFSLDVSAHYYNKQANHLDLFEIRQVLNKSFYEMQLDKILAKLFYGTAIE
jgi:hypothetical protein